MSMTSQKESDSNVLKGTKRIVKTKFPKQEKDAKAPNEPRDNNNVVSNKQDEKPSTPSIKSNSSKSQEKPISSNTKQKLDRPSGLTHSNKHILTNTFTAKKMRYIAQIREAQDKQRVLVTSYDELQKLYNKLLASGGKDLGRLEDLVPLPQCAISRSIDHSPVDGEPIPQFELSLRAMPESMLGLNRDILSKQTDFITRLYDGLNQDSDNLTIDTLKTEITYELDCYKKEKEQLEERREEIEQELQTQTNELVERATKIWNDCQLQRESVEDGSGQFVNDEKATKELRLEKERTLKARTTIRELKTNLTNVETKYQQAQEHVKQMEAQLKQKESLADQKLKELTKNQKASEVAIGKLEKQKETIESRVSKLKEELEFKETEMKKLTNEYKKQVEDIEHALENERLSKKELESQFEEFKRRNAKLEEKCKQLLEMHDKRKEIISEDDHHTEHEIQLFNELKETERALIEKNEIIKHLEFEREEIIAAVNEADQEKDDSKKRLSAELVKKSDELKNVKNQYAQLQENYKKIDQKAQNLEQKLQEITEFQKYLNKNSSKANYEAKVIQQETLLLDLRTSLAAANERNSELEKMCTRSKVKLEQYKRYMRDLDKDNKVRREMQFLLQNKDHDENLENGQIASTIHSTFTSPHVVQELYEELEDKELQIMKLEKLVKQMEKHEESSQIQRTRLENQIANLQIALKGREQSHRYVNEKQTVNLDDILNSSGAERSSGFRTKLYRKQKCERCLATDQNQISVNTTYRCVVQKHKKHFDRLNACKEFHDKRFNFEKISHTKSNSPICKWLLKPFCKENYGLLNHNKRNGKDWELSRDFHNRHHRKRFLHNVDPLLLQSSQLFYSSSQEYL